MSAYKYVYDHDTGSYLFHTGSGTVELTRQVTDSFLEVTRLIGFDYFKQGIFDLALLQTEDLFTKLWELPDGSLLGNDVTQFLQGVSEIFGLVYYPQGLIKLFFVELPGHMLSEFDALLEEGGYQCSLVFTSTSPWVAVMSLTDSI